MDNLFASLESVIFSEHKELLVNDISRGIFLKQDFTFDDESRVIIQLGSFARADVWNSVKDELLCIDIAISDAQLYLNSLYIPKVAQNKGIADKLISIVARWIHSENESLYFNKEVVLLDISPRYGGSAGVTSHLLAKHGLTAVAPNY